MQVTLLGRFGSSFRKFVNVSGRPQVVVYAGRAYLKESPQSSTFREVATYVVQSRSMGEGCRDDFSTPDDLPNRGDCSYGSPSGSPARRH